MPRVSAASMTSEDFVRMEIVAALERKIRVIPVLVGGARMPRKQDLPEALAPLSRRNAIELSETRFHADVSRLIEAIEKARASVEQQAPPVNSVGISCSLRLRGPAGDRPATSPRRWPAAFGGRAPSMKTLADARRRRRWGAVWPTEMPSSRAQTLQVRRCQKTVQEERSPIASPAPKETVQEERSPIASPAPTETAAMMAVLTTPALTDQKDKVSYSLG